MLVGEQARAADGQMHTRTGDARQRGNGAFDLALQGTLIIDPLRELGNTKVRIVEQLEANVAAARHARGHQSHARVIHLVGSHGDASTTVGNGMWHLPFVERSHYFSGIAFVHVAKQKLLARCHHPPQRSHGQAQQGHGAHDQADTRRSLQRKIEIPGVHGLGLIGKGGSVAYSWIRANSW